MSASDGSGGAREVRAEDAFDVARVHAWLLEAQVLERSAADTMPEVRQFPGGASNLTYLLRYPDADWILRRPPAGKKPKSGHDMAREYRIQRALAGPFPWVPTMIALCEEDAVLGAPFYVMARVDGVIPRRSMPAALRADAPATRALCDRFLDGLVALHQVDWAGAGLNDLYRGEGYVARQLDGWRRRYAAARTWNVPSWRRTIDWLERHVPADRAPVLIHNDYRLDNTVFDPVTREVRAILDWELATVGDPRADLGNLLAYWVQADDDRIMQGIRRQPSHAPGMRTRREVATYVGERSGFGVEEVEFFVVLGLFRLAGIVQQIAYRYHHRQTRNPAFRWFWVFNHYLHHRAQRAMRGDW